MYFYFSSSPHLAGFLLLVIKPKVGLSEVDTGGEWPFWCSCKAVFFLIFVVSGMNFLREVDGDVSVGLAH